MPKDTPTPDAPDAQVDKTGPRRHGPKVPIQKNLVGWLHQRTYVCELCNETKPRTGPSQKCCIECRQARNQAYHRARHTQNHGDILLCRKCGKEFALQHGGQAYCTRCQPTRRRGDPLCIHCGTGFERTSNRQQYCADCRKVRVSKGKRRWHSKKKDDPQYKKRKSEYMTRRLTEKYHSDPTFAISVRVRAAVNRCLNGGKNWRHWEELLGYTATDLVRHLERQFLPGMTWNNRNLWELDHIQPLSSFRFTSAEDPEFKAAWALSNLRPLWRRANRQKRDQRLYLI